MQRLLNYPTIAIVEDEPSIAEAVQLILEEEGYTVTWYTRGAHLLHALPQEKPDVVLLDGTHPAHYNEWKCADALRRAGCLVIMFTAHVSAVHEVRRTPRGRAFAAAIAKPFAIETLLATITHVWHDAAVSVKAS